MLDPVLFEFSLSLLIKEPDCVISLLFHLVRHLDFDFGLDFGFDSFN